MVDVRLAIVVFLTAAVLLLALGVGVHLGRIGRAPEQEESSARSRALGWSDRWQVYRAVAAQPRAAVQRSSRRHLNRPGRKRTERRNSWYGRHRSHAQLRSALS